jgi:biotin transport system substrate-specific component
VGILAGPTGGYLFGFVIGAYVTGFINEKVDRKSALFYFLYLIPCVIIIYSCGVLQLGMIKNFTISRAFLLGMLPFLPGEIIKMVIVSLIAERLYKANKLTYPQ